MTLFSRFISRLPAVLPLVLSLIATQVGHASASPSHQKLVTNAQHYFSQDPVVIVKGKTQVHALPSGDPFLKAIGFDPAYFQAHEPDGAVPTTDEEKGYLVFWFSSSNKNCSSQSDAQSSAPLWRLPNGSLCLRPGYQVVVTEDTDGEPTRLVIEEVHRIGL